MSSKKRWFAALAVPVLAVSGVGVASAQTADTDGDTDATTGEPDDERRGRRGGRAFGAVAEAIGIEASALKDAVKAGQTVAEVAAANGADIDQIIAGIVADAQARADEAGRDDFDAAALSERLTSAANGEGDFGRRGHRGRGGLRGSGEAVQELLGLERSEIKASLADGGTLADVAAEQGVTLDELVSTIVDDIETRLSESDRGLPEDFDAEALSERVTEKVTTEREPGERRGRRGAPRFGDADAPAETTGV